MFEHGFSQQRNEEEKTETASEGDGEAIFRERNGSDGSLHRKTCPGGIMLA